MDNDAGEAVDFTQIPKELNRQYDALDEDASLRPTVIKTGERWTKRSQASLLSKLSASTVDEEQQKTERNRAFDLLDALSRSGTLPIACAELHVVVAATHCFDKSLMETVIEDNINPIEKFERSELIVASTIHGVPATVLLKGEEQSASVAAHSPQLLDVAERT